MLGRPRSREVASDARLFLRNKKQEWEEYRSEVTAFELRKNLPVL
ncbi:glutamine synthetase [Streptomyces sp. GD-15H]